MPTLSSSLHFDGRCEEAFKHYERCLGGKVAVLLKWSESPLAANAPPGWAEKILYARLTVGDSELLGGDLPPDQYERPRGFAVMLEMNDPAEAERVFNALATNGTVFMPLQQTFWAARYGGLIDQFGIRWEINCEGPH